MSQVQKLQQMRAAKDPVYGANLMLAQMFQNIQGEPGYTPVKGKDYFTPQEVREIIAYILSQIPRPKDGDPGKDGSTPIKGIDYRDGIDAETPVRGIDYWTAADQDKIVKDVLKKVPKPKPVTVPSTDELTESVRQRLDYKDIQNAPDLTDLPKLIAFLKAGGFRGGGDTIAAGSNVTISTSNGVKTISSSGGSGFSTLAATETPNGATTVFTFSGASAQPSYLVVDNVWMKATTAAGTVNWTWNAGTKKATLTIPPVEDIWGVQ